MGGRCFKQHLSPRIILTQQERKIIMAKDTELIWRPGDISAYPVQTEQHIHKSMLVVFNDEGYLQPGKKSFEGIFAGIAQRDCDNTLGNSGDLIYQVIKTGIAGPFKVHSEHPKQHLVGKTAYLYDDDTVIPTASDKRTPVGKFDSVDEEKGTCMIRLLT